VLTLLCVLRSSALPYTPACSAGCVLVHCAQGMSRSGTICIGYLMWRERLSRETALAHVQQARPVVDPNEGFDLQLREFERMNCDLSSWKGWDKQRLEQCFRCVWWHRVKGQGESSWHHRGRDSHAGIEITLGMLASPQLHDRAPAGYFQYASQQLAAAAIQQQQYLRGSCQFAPVRGLQPLYRFCLTLPLLQEAPRQRAAGGARLFGRHPPLPRAQPDRG
jgi:hypothetical protein